MFSCGCRFDEDGKADDDDDFDGGDEVEVVGVDANGCPTEATHIGDLRVIVHYDDLPASDVTVVDGIRVTTALRTVIDLAPELDGGRLQKMVDHCLARGLFTVEEARARASEPDMLARRGAVLLLRVLSE